jgi:hypothetical protein
MLSFFVGQGQLGSYKMSLGQQTHVTIVFLHSILKCYLSASLLAIFSEQEGVGHAR